MATKVRTSLPGIAHYPWLNQPDYEYDADGIYHVKLKMDSEDPKVAKFIEWIDAEHAKAIEAFIVEQLEEGKYKTKAALMAAVKKQRKVADLAGDKPYQYETDDDGADTNIIRVNFKMKAHVKVKKTGKEFDLKPKIFDAKGKVLKNPPLIYSGSLLRVSYTPQYWGTIKLGASIRLRMEAIQVIELVTGGGSDNASDYGFGEEEGYEASEEQLNAKAEKAAEQEADDAGADADPEDEDF